MKESVIESLKYMAKVIARQKFPCIPLRGEEINYELLQSLLERGYLRYSRHILSTIENSEVVEISAPKGIGKTTNILGAFNLLMEKESVFGSGIYFDPVTGKIDVFNPRIYVSEEEAKKKNITTLDSKGLIESADVVCVDNFHYVADLIKEEETKDIGEKLIDELALRTLEELEKNKKIIISTENPINYYLRITESENLEELSKKIETKISYMLPPSFELLCCAYNVKADSIISEIWKKYSDNLPRSFVNMVNTFGKRTNKGSIEIKWDDIVKKYGIFNEIYSMTGDGELSRFITENPEITSPHRVKTFLEKYNIKSPEDCEKKIKEIEISSLKIKAEIEKIEKLPEIKEWKEIKKKLGSLKTERYKYLRKYRKTGDEKILERAKEIEEKINEVKNFLKSFEEKNNKLLKEYEAKKRKYSRMLGDKTVVSKMYEILLSPPYNGLEGEELEKRIKLLSSIYDNHGRFVKLEQVKEEFIKHINVGSYYDEILKYTFPELLK